MGLFDALRGKNGEEKPGASGQKKKEEPAAAPVGKYQEACALCGNPGTEKKWMGQYWHKKCVRLAKRGARKMI